MKMFEDAMQSYFKSTAILVCPNNNISTYHNKSQPDQQVRYYINWYSYFPLNKI